MISRKPRVQLPQLNDLLKFDTEFDFKVPPSGDLSAEEHFAGLVAAGGSFDFSSLKHSYENGMFPWPHGEEVYLWFCPVWRGVIDFEDLHVPRSLVKSLRKAPYKFTLNRAFEAVIDSCSLMPRKGQSGTWIVDELKEGYCQLQKKGMAYSLEAWRDNQLVAGIYGVYAGGSFSAESMFGRERDSSKHCLIKLIQWLKHSGLSFLDVQMLTSVSRQMGGKYISRSDFLKRLQQLQSRAPSLDLGYIDALES